MLLLLIGFVNVDNEQDDVVDADDDDDMADGLWLDDDVLYNLGDVATDAAAAINACL